jgi:hypothetical protein
VVCVCGDAHAFLVQFFLGHDLVFFCFCFFFFGGLQHMFHLLTLPIKERHYQTNPCSFFIWSHILWNVHSSSVVVLSILCLEMFIIDQVLSTLHLVASFLWKFHGTFHTLIVGLNQCWAVITNCTHRWVSWRFLGFIVQLQVALL